MSLKAYAVLDLELDVEKEDRALDVLPGSSTARKPKVRAPRSDPEREVDIEAEKASPCTECNGVTKARLGITNAEPKGSEIISAGEAIGAVEVGVRLRTELTEARGVPEILVAERLVLGGIVKEWADEDAEVAEKEEDDDKIEELSDGEIKAGYLLEAA